MYYILIFSLISKRKKCSLLQVACLNQIYNASYSSLCSPNFIASMLAVFISIYTVFFLNCSNLILFFLMSPTVDLPIPYCLVIVLYEVPLSISFRTSSLFSLSTFLLLFAAGSEDNSSAILLPTYS